MSAALKTITVVCAAIIKENAVLATQRGYGSYAGSWEFPGGKVENGEAPQDALVREIQEELEASIVVDSFLTHVSYDYPEFHLEMDCYVCSLSDEHINLVEHMSAKWLEADALSSVEWLAADEPIVEKLHELLS